MALETEPSRSAREREVFLGALEQSDPAARAVYLEAACGDDAALRQRIDALLREESEVGSFLEVPVLGPPSHTLRLSESALRRGAIASASEAAIGTWIGPYKLLQKIGEGGCGVVYMAEQEKPVRRRVALKVIKLGMDTKSVIARFEAERQALALMDHANIARVLDAGATETGRPYFVMELVRGTRITEYCDQNGLTPAERLQLFIQVCNAIQHAHQKGIIHRDIKPSNVLVTLHDGVPVPKIIDFGIAKATEQRLTDKTLFTEFQAFIGTPAYMSPEQAEMSALDVDTRSDIYALGVLLYEMLTGRTPFDAATLVAGGLDECRRTIRETEPPRPSTRLATLVDAELTTTAKQRRTEPLRLVHLLRGDLDWIVMKCLEKDRTRRYATANALALDVQRFLDNEPVLARPPSNLYRLRKLLRRHQGSFAAAAAIAVTLVAGVAFSSWQAVRATRAGQEAVAARQHETELRTSAEWERERAEQEKAAARLNEYIADINLAQQSLANGNFGRAVQLLDKHRPTPAEPVDLRGFEWRYLWRVSRGDFHLAFARQQGPINSLAVSPGGDLLAVGQWDRLSVWQTSSRSLVTNLARGAGSLAFLPDGRSLVSAGFGPVRIWNTADWTEAATLPETTGPVVLSPDGSLLATVERDRGRPGLGPGPGGPPGSGGPGGVRIWETAGWKPVRSLPDHRLPLAFSPDGRWLATEAEAGLVLVPLDGRGAEVLLEDSTNVVFRGGPGFRPDRLTAFSPDGRMVLAARNTLSPRGVFVLSLWDAATGRELGTLPESPDQIEHTGMISSLAFSPDGQLLATASMDHSVRLWDVARRKRVATLQGSPHELWALAFTSDGGNLITGSKGGDVRIWRPRAAVPDEDSAEGRLPLAMSWDGRTLGALGLQDNLVFLNLATEEPEREFRLEPTRFRYSSVALSRDLLLVAQGLDDGTVRLLNTDTGEASSLKVSERRVELTLSPDGRTLITGGRDQALRWWDLRLGRELPWDTEAGRVVFSPDGRTLAAFQRTNVVEIWDVASRSLRTNLVSESLWFFPVAAFSPKGDRLAVSTADDSIQLWEVDRGQLLGACVGHKQGVTSLAFSPDDGRTLASTSDDSTFKFWNVETQQELLSIRRLGGRMSGLMFSPDGRLLVAGAGFGPQSGALRFFRAPDFQETDLPVE